MLIRNKYYEISLIMREQKIGHMEKKGYIK